MQQTKPKLQQMLPPTISQALQRGNSLEGLPVRICQFLINSAFPQLPRAQAGNLLGAVVLAGAMIKQSKRNKTKSPYGYEQSIKLSKKV